MDFNKQSWDLFNSDISRKPRLCITDMAEKPDKQQKEIHLDFGVSNVEYTIEHAIKLGAKKVDAQFSSDWTVMIDPEGHPFCICKRL